MVPQCAKMNAAGMAHSMFVHPIQPNPLPKSQLKENRLSRQLCIAAKPETVEARLRFAVLLLVFPILPIRGPDI